MLALRNINPIEQKPELSHSPKSRPPLLEQAGADKKILGQQTPRQSQKANKKILR
jgi:hypothetical protein